DVCQEIIEEERVTTTQRQTQRQTRLAPEVAPEVAPLPDRRHVLDVEDWAPSELRAILARATAMRQTLEHGETPLKTLQGAVLVNLFYENSTRTRVSFERAGKLLGAEV